MRKHCSDIRQQCRIVFSDRGDTSYLSSTYCLERVSRLKHEKGKPGKSSRSPWVWRRKMELTETKTVRVCSPEYQRENCTERESAGDLHTNQFMVWRDYLRPENNQEESSGAIPGVYTDLGWSLFPPPEQINLVACGGPSKVCRRLSP